MNFQKSNQSAYVNFLRAKYDAWTGKVLVKSYPYIIGIDPSSFCQLRCPLCPTGVENESRRSGQRVSFRKRTMLTADLFDALLDELGEYLFLIMFYNWGEPLLNKQLPDFIRKAKAYDIYTEIHTNLSLRLGDEYIEALLRSGIDDIAASLDGFSATSYQTYRRGGNYELAQANIERFARARDQLGLKTNIIWNFLVFSFNEHEIEAARQHCNRLGIIFNRREAFIADPDWLPSYRRGEAKPATAPPPASAEPSPCPKRPQKPIPCAWHYNYSMINADGSVSPCCAPWEQSHDFGIVAPGRSSFADVWNNDLYRKSRAAFAGKQVAGLDDVDTLCLHCPYGQKIQNLYSGNDLEVRRRFAEVFKDSDPWLERAFGLLDDRDRFVRFYRDHSDDEFLTIRAESVELPIAISVKNSDQAKSVAPAPRDTVGWKMRLARARSIWRAEGFRALVRRTRLYFKSFPIPKFRVQ